MDRSLHFPSSWGEKVDGILYLNIGIKIQSFVPSGRKLEIKYICKECGSEASFLYTEEEFNVIFPYFISNYPQPLGLSVDYKQTRALFAIRNILCERCVINHDYNRYVKDNTTYNGIDIMLNSSGLTEHFDGIIEGYSSEDEDSDIKSDIEKHEKELDREYNTYQKECNEIENNDLKKHFPDHPDWYSKKWG